jgi:hypothetical protein
MIETKVPGNPISVKNFYMDPEASVFRDKSYVEITDKNNYSIIFYAYNPDDPSSKKQAFVISIENPDIAKARNIAEQKFLTMLDITKDKACKLVVNVSVSGEINEFVAGENYGLSFCPDGKPFPSPWS